MAISSCICECLFLGNLLSELNYEVFPINVYEDNQSTIKIATTKETKRSKHIDVKYHFVRECVQKKEIKLIYVSTENQLADMMTKALSKVKLKKLTNLIGLGQC